MPVIEAMACGVPCVVSSHPSLDEACGDAAVRADPDSPEEFAEGIRRALADREELVDERARPGPALQLAGNGTDSPAELR